MSLFCSKCERPCKDKKGLSLHEKKCGVEKEPVSFICSFCTKELCTKHVLEKHMSICRAYTDKIKEDKLKDTISSKDREIEEYKSQKDNEIQQLKMSHQSMLNMACADRDKYYQDFLSLKEAYKALESRNLQLEKKIDNLELDRKEISNKMIFFAEKSAQQTSSTIIHNTNNLMQNNLVQLQNFNPSMIVGHIRPPDVVIHNTSQLVDHLLRLGFSNFYRISDRSRKSIVWHDEKGNAIKDSNCSLISKQLISTLRPDLDRQMAYLQHELERMNSIPEHQRDEDARISILQDISFTSGLLQQNKHTMKALQTEIGSRAKNKNDTSIDVPKVRTYLNFISQLQLALSPAYKEWIGLSTKDLSRYLSKQIRSYYDVEAGSKHSDKPYILVKDDNGYTRMIYEKEFQDLWKKAIEPLVKNEVYGILKHSVQDDVHYNKKIAGQTISWLKKLSTNEDTTEGHDMRELLYGIASA